MFWQLNTCFLIEMGYQTFSGTDHDCLGLRVKGLTRMRDKEALGDNENILYAGCGGYTRI